MEFVARSVHGVEWVAADEIAGVLGGAGDIRLDRREVRFRLASVDPRLVELRTVDDVFVQIGRIPDVGTTKAAIAPLSAALGRLPWRDALAAIRELRALPSDPRFDVVASLEGKRSYNRFAVENGAGAAIAQRRPEMTHLARTADGRAPGPTDVTIRLFVRAAEVIAAVRLTAAPLHRRAWKQDTGPGTLHPPMAAALVRVAQPIDGALVDPFCGDGTIAIEAALAGAGQTVVAADLDPVRLAGARRNAQRAGVSIDLVLADAGRPPWRRHGFDTVITNPPWGLAVAAGGELATSPERYWRALPDLLGPDGSSCMIIDAELDGPRASVATLARVRLAGRVSDVLTYTPLGERPRPLPASLATWRRRAIETGVVTEDGF